MTRTYNAANQMTYDGTNTLSYDNNGNLTGDGVNAYTWDRANHLLSVGNHSYVYDGLGNRVQQTVSTVVTDYLNDVQPGLVKLLRQGDGSNVEHFVHAPRGIHAVDDGTDWNWYMQDGLGSVRGLVDDAAVVQGSMAYDPYGNPMGAYGVGFGFTGEQTDSNGSVFLRARYYEPGLGVFSALDPFEGVFQNSRTLNGYDYVWGNPINRADASGLCSQATREAGRQAGLALRAGTELANLSVDGAIPDLVANTFCAAEDFGPTFRNVAVGGASLEIAATYVAGAVGTASASVVIAATGLGLLVGVAFGLGLYINPVFYTPDQLDDMRPPTPSFTPTPGATPNPMPTGTQPAPLPQPQPLPAPAPDRVSDPTRVNDPCPDNNDNGCRIEVRSYTVNRQPFRQSALQHTYVIFTGRNGWETLFRGGPEWPTNGSRCPNCTSPRGALNVVYGVPYGFPFQTNEPGIDVNPNFNTTTVMQGESACEKYHCLTAQSMRIHNSCYAYNVMGPNSNSVISSLLFGCNIPIHKPTLLPTPGWGITNL